MPAERRPAARRGSASTCARVRGVVDRRSAGPGRRRPRSAASSSSSASASPDTTVDGGPLTAAIDSRPSHAASSSCDVGGRQRRPTPCRRGRPAPAAPGCAARPPAPPSASDRRPATHGGGDLALRVADHRGRLDAARPPQRGAGTPSPPTAPAARTSTRSSAGRRPAARRSATSRRTAPAPRSHSAIAGSANTGEESSSSGAPCRPTGSPARGRRTTAPAVRRTRR